MAEDLIRTGSRPYGYLLRPPRISEGISDQVRTMLGSRHRQAAPRNTFQRFKLFEQLKRLATASHRHPCPNFDNLVFYNRVPAMPSQPSRQWRGDPRASMVWCVGAGVDAASAEAGWLAMVSKKCPPYVGRCGLHPPT